MTLGMPHSRYSFEAIGMQRPYNTFALAYRLVVFEAMVSIALTLPFCSYKFLFQEHAIHVSYRMLWVAMAMPAAKFNFANSVA